LQSRASETIQADSTAALFRRGNVPGCPQHIGQMFLLGSNP
jgi:hypothetical protein